MKVLLINGSPRQNGNTAVALARVSQELSKEGIESEIVWIGNSPVRGCIACGQCAAKSLRRCIFDDDICNRISEKFSEVDGLIIGSPVYYAAASGQVTAFLDRAFYSAGRSMDGKPGAAIVSCRRGGASAAFDQLNKYFSISNMPVVTSNYWNQVHGSRAEDVKQDLSP